MAEHIQGGDCFCMGSLREEVAYLHGLTNGLDVKGNSSEEKLLLNIIDALDRFAEEFEDVRTTQQDLEKYVEAIDEDLTELQEEIYEETDDYVEMECPECHEKISVEANLLEEPGAVEVSCPSCGGIVYENAIDVDNLVMAHHPGI
jgi:hypothetical protein